MAKLGQADVARLLAALRGEISSPAPVAPYVPQQSSGPERVRVHRSIDAAVSDGTLARAIAATLESYLSAKVRVAASADAAAIAGEYLRFIADDQAGLGLDLDALLAAALGDVMIGGNGRGGRHSSRPARGRLLEPLVARILGALAAAAGNEQPKSVRLAGVGRDTATERDALTGGTLAVGEIAGTSAGEIEGSWRASMSAQQPGQAAAMEHAPPSVARAPEIVPAAASIIAGVSVHSDARQPPGSRERVLTSRHSSDAALSDAVEAARAQLGSITRCEAVIESIQVTRVEAPVLPRGDLKLAMIAGGQGSLVLSADRAAISSMAASAVGVTVPPEGDPGAVVLDAVEAVLRAAMRGFAEKLPSIAGSPQRFVRLAEGALPARSPHYAISVPMHVGERPATLQWLVPAWMTGAQTDSRTPDGK